MDENKDLNTNTNEIKNKNEEKEVYDNILSIPEKCQRCRFHSVEIMCKECYPIIYFCFNCSKNLHSMESKMNHNIFNLKDINQNLFDENKNIDEKKILSEYNNNLLIDENTKNYINNIKSLYLTEKKNLMKKITNLEKSLEKLKHIYSQKIQELENNKNLELILLIQKKDSDYQSLIENKDSKINFLLQKNEELNKHNEELLSEIGENNKIINDLNNINLNLQQLIQSQKIEIEILNKEKNIIKGKMDKFNTLYNEEKKEIINAYEEQILKINKEYVEHKEKIKYILLQRENEIIDIQDSYNIKINELKKELEEYRNKNENMNKDYDELKTINNKQIYEIEDLKNQLNNGEIKYINECENKNIMKTKLEKYQLALENLKNRNEYLNNIIFGKTKK